MGSDYESDYDFNDGLKKRKIKVFNFAEANIETNHHLNKANEEKCIYIISSAYDANFIETKKIIELNKEYYYYHEFISMLPGIHIAVSGTHGKTTTTKMLVDMLDDEKIAVNLICVDNTWAGTWGAELGKYSPEEINGTHTATYTGSAPNGMIVTLDAIKLREKFPNAIMVINEIKCDGTPIQFDANKFFYGDIENNGNFRVELFNIYGKGSAEGKVKESPFSTAANIDNEPALAFSSSMEVTFTIITEPTYTPNLITINPSWGGTWGYNQGANFSIIVDENNKLDFSQKEFDITYESADHSAGSIMTFIEVADLYGAFPATHATLDALYLDGTEVTGWDKSMVVDSNENPKYRLELFNCYGVTRDACAFGTRDGDNMAALAFSSSIRTKFTFHSLFATPQW